MHNQPHSQPSICPAEGPSQEAKDILYAILTMGGISLHIGTGTHPSSGYMVGLPDHEQTFPLRHVTLADVDSYLDGHVRSNGLDTAGHHHQVVYVGAWVDDENTVYLDLSINVATEDDAVRLGHEYRQRAVYDVSADRDIPLVPAPVPA